MTDFAHARKTMVDTQLRTSSITDRRLLAAMGAVPRERFVPTDRTGLAYIDEGVPLAGGRRIPAPAPFAKLVQLAVIGPTDRVLDVGAATGYSTAIIAALAGSVVGLESDAALADTARTNLAGLGIGNAEIRQGPLDGAGFRDGAFDVVVVETAVGEVPQGLFAQLREDGRLVALIGSGMSAVAHLFVKSAKGVAGRAEFNASLPGAGRTERTDEFVF